jgi:hypothetical protein
MLSRSGSASRTSQDRPCRAEVPGTYCRPCDPPNPTPATTCHDPAVSHRSVHPVGATPAVYVEKSVKYVAIGQAAFRRDETAR